MEAVRAFNNELSSLYETKPPISRAKMATVTKTAMKAIKFYKHVVQSVEKFIQKCKPEYKVPGLYVIDSVVRQSRHQFGVNKDVFAPRFTKNIITTFQNLFKCPGDERSKIVRVLNLWQKNEVFPSEIIQPLLDLAADPTKPSLIAAAQSAVDKVVTANTKPGTQPNKSSSSAAAGDAQGALSHTAAENMLATQNDMLNTVTQLLQNTNTSNTSLDAQQQQLQQLQTLQQQLIQQTALMQQPTGGGPPLIDANLLAQIQTLTNQLLQKTENKHDEDSGFNKKLLDFDYGDSEDEDDKRHSIAGEVRNIFGDKGLMQQIHQVSQSIQSNSQLSGEIDKERRRILEQQQAEFDQQISQPPPPQFSNQPPMPGEAGGSYPGGGAEEGEYTEDALQDEDFREHHHQLRDRERQEREDSRDRRGERRGSSRRSRDRSRTPKRRKRSRSRSRDRRRRSRSRERHRRSKSKDREKRERERERRKQGIPAVRANFVTICTCTIWIGHLNKFTLEEDLRTAVENYGSIASINMVPPRGCAYVVMEKRKDANKAVDRLRGQKVNGNSVKTAWAQSTGMRNSSFKDSWDLDEGAIYIPYDQLPADLSNFLDGAIIDHDSLPEHLKDIAVEKSQLETNVPDNQQQQQQQQQSQAPPTSVPMMTPQQPHMMPGMMGGGIAPGMPPGMMPPGMMMSQLQRGGPAVSMPPSSLAAPPGLPPALPPGAPPLPPQMMAPGGPNTGLPPGVRPPVPGVLPPGMSIANTAASTLAQNIQNIMSSAAGVLPSSTSGPPRPSGFTPGAGQVPRFGFNPNMPPPGFRLPPPPPGFGGPPVGAPMMPAPGGMLAGGPPSEGPGMSGPPRPLGPKQPEMMWPPDSNEMDEDNEEDEEEASSSNNGPAAGPGNSARGQEEFSGGPGPMGGMASKFGGPPGGMMPGPDSPGMRMRGPVPPHMQGGFPPGPGMPGGPPGQMWGMGRMGGPRGMRGMGPRGQQDMFPMGGRGGHMGGPPMGGPFMGPGGRGFPPRGPVSLLDLPDIKPTEGSNFEGQSFSYENDYQEEDELNTDNVNEDQENVDNENQEPPAEEEGASNVYPFNSWKSVKSNNRNDSGNRNRDRSRDDDRGHRGRDNDHRDNDRDGDYNRDRDRDRRGSRGDWERDRSRDWDRGDRDRDRDKRRDRNDKRDERSDRGNRRDRQRKSRWCDIDESINEEGDINSLVQDNVAASENTAEMPVDTLNEENVGDNVGMAENAAPSAEDNSIVHGAPEDIEEGEYTDHIPASEEVQAENQESGNITDTQLPDVSHNSANEEYTSTNEMSDHPQNDTEDATVSKVGESFNEENHEFKNQQESEPIESEEKYIAEPIETGAPSVEDEYISNEAYEMSAPTDHVEHGDDYNTENFEPETAATSDIVQSNGPMSGEQENGEQVETCTEQDENVEPRVQKEISQDLEEGELSS